jgi:hypothetical protein
MASKSRKKRNRRAVRKGLKQKIAVGFSVAVLCLCAASVAQLFVRQTDGNGARARRLRWKMAATEGCCRRRGQRLAAMGIDVVSTGNAARRLRRVHAGGGRRGGEVRLLADRMAAGTWSSSAARPARMPP